jgi:hypothetical protein
MKSIFGKKDSNETSHDNAINGGRAPQHVGHGKKQSIIETLRSTDTISPVPSAASFSNAESMVKQTNKGSSYGNTVGTNYQQLNKKKSNSPWQRRKNTGTSVLAAPLELPPNPNVLAEPTRFTHLFGHDLTTSFSTSDGVSVLEPPYLAALNHERQSRKLPPEPMVSTSQQQYRPPSIPIPAITTNSSNNEENDGIDHEQFNRLLTQQSFVQKGDETLPQHQVHDSHDDDEDDDIVPFTCFPQRNPLATKQLHTSNVVILSDEIATKIPNNNSLYSKFQVFFVKTGLIYILIVIFTAVSMVYGLFGQLAYLKRHRYHSQELLDIQVAFLGNAYFFVNDIPRLLESLSQGHVHQNSCLHAGGSLSDLWATGNGMYNLWQTDEAMIEYSTMSSGNDDVSSADDNASVATTYDFGVCTVVQLLLGYDEYIGYGNKYGKYYSDGLNPCMVDPDYGTFVEQQLNRNPVSWDFVLIVEQTKRMAVAEAREETVYFLKNRYGPLIKEAGAVPVIVDTHAFWSSKSNMTGLTDIPTFAALIAQGVSDFTSALASVLPSNQAPLVAPIGLAYLTIWEEDYSLWQKLFVDDGIHSSVYGSYLFACVLYATLFDQLPNHDGTDEFDLESLFMDTRKIVGQASFPSLDEVEYLRNVAGRVALRGYVPPSLLDALDTLQQ